MSFTKSGLVFSTNKSNLTNLKSGKSKSPRKMEGFSFGGAGMTFFADFSKMKKLANNDEDLLRLISKFDFIITEINQNDGVVRLKSTEKSKNILRTLLELGVEMSQNNTNRYEDYDNDDTWDDEDWDDFYGLDDEDMMIAPM